MTSACIPGAPVILESTDDPEATAHAAEALGLTVVAEAPSGSLALVHDARGWGLVDPATDAHPVRCDLIEGELGRRLRQRGGRDERLARALGVRRHPRPRVLDATAGLGRESVLAAALGCSVVACERSPVVAWLLRDGLERAATDPRLAPLVERIDVRTADAREVLRSLADDERPDVVVLDPMFPERSKAALAKQEMQILQRLLGPQPDLDDLFDAAVSAACRRVVVKRPAHVPATGTRAPDVVVPGRAARYDVYLVPPSP